MHGLDVLADLENVKQFVQKQKLLKSFGLRVYPLHDEEVQLHVGHIYVLYVHVPVVVDSVRCACMLQWKQMMISYLITFLIIHCSEFSQQGFIVQVCKVLASASPLCWASVYVCVLMCSLQDMEPLIGLCKAVVLHHQRSLEEVVVGGDDHGTPLDPFVPALLTCPKLSVLKLGRGALSPANTLMVLEKLTSLQEFVLKDVSVDLRQGHPLDKVCLNTVL